MKVNCFTYCLSVLDLSRIFLTQSLLYHVALQGVDGMYNLPGRCVQSGHASHKLLRLLTGIFGENKEVKMDFNPKLSHLSFTLAWLLRLRGWSPFLA